MTSKGTHMTTTTTGLTYATAPNKIVRGGNAIDYAYREIGNGTVPLVLLQHFRGNLENWDPAFELYHSMLAPHPHRINRGALWGSARSAKG